MMTKTQKRHILQELKKIWRIKRFSAIHLRESKIFVFLPQLVVEPESGAALARFAMA
jgi:hypothetical protein